MKVYIDGALVEVLNDIKIVVEDPETCSQLHITLGPEGYIIDLVREGEVIETEGQQYDELVTEMLP